MTDPVQKITALCKKHGFECRPDTPFAIQFDCRRHPGTCFQLIGADPEQIYQKFLAVLQAMGWESPTPAGISANQIQPGPDWYEVFDAADHKTLEVGDSVQMVKTPLCAWKLLYRSDGTLHRPLDDENNYVTLISKPLPTPDAPAPKPTQFNINNSVKVRLTDHSRNILREKQDLRHSFERVDAQGYTRLHKVSAMGVDEYIRLTHLQWRYTSML